MKIYATIKEAVLSGLSDLYNLEQKDISIQIEQTNPTFDGDITVVVFPFLKYSRKAPEATATEIGDFIKEKTEIVIDFNVVKGFLNLQIDPVYWIEHLKRSYVSDNELYQKTNNPKRFLIEYSSPNTNKPLHLGHIRNNLIGHSVSEILKVRGHEVIKANLINDRGIHICKSMIAWEEFGNGETPDTNNLKGDHLIGKYYVSFDQHYKEEVASLISNGESENTAKQNAPLLKKAQDLLRKWEMNEPEVRKRWEMMNSWTYKGFDETYSRMGISFDKIYHESNTYLLGKDIVLDGLKNGIFYKKDDGSVWCDLTDEGLDEKILLRADGTSVYMTQDIGTAQLKADDFNADKSVYIVGNEQDYHFNVLKLILKKLGKDYAETVFHLSYGMVELPEGKMKSREGTVVDADDLMDEMAETSESYLKESGKIQGMDDEEIKVLSEMIGLGALKYFILKTDIKKNITFNPKESIDFQGHTGPFIQYAYARIKSILRNGKIEEGSSLNYNIDFDLNEVEHELMIKVYHFEKALIEAENDLNPGAIANYVFELAKIYNRFYHDHPILKEENHDIKNFRLQLSVVVSDIIKKSMNILGVEVPERM